MATPQPTTHHILSHPTTTMTMRFSRGSILLILVIFSYYEIDGSTAFVTLPATRQYASPLPCEGSGHQHRAIRIGGTQQQQQRPSGSGVFPLLAQTHDTRIVPSFNNDTRYGNNKFLQLLSRLRRHHHHHHHHRQWMAHLLGNATARLRNCSSAFRRRIVLFALSLSLILSVGMNPAMAAVTGGRAGGTFRSSSPPRPSMSRNYHSPGRSTNTMLPRHVPTRMPRVIYTSPPIGHNSFAYDHGGSGGLMMMSRSTTMSKKDILVLGGVTGLVTYGIVNGRRQQDAQGEGATATSIMAAVNVPDRASPNSIVRRINEITQRTDTSSQAGVQTLISEVCLELVRQQASLQAAWSDSNHYKLAKTALKDFQGRSVSNRSRYDQETMSKFSIQNYNAKSAETTDSDESNIDNNGKATMAVVSVHFVTEGEDISHFKNMRADVVNLLRWTAATVPVTALLAGEVLWSPQDIADTLTRQDIDERYPELTPLI